jgi:hypothetical protein
MSDRSRRIVRRARVCDRDETLVIISSVVGKRTWLFTANGAKEFKLNFAIFVLCGEKCATLSNNTCQGDYPKGIENGNRS